MVAARTKLDGQDRQQNGNMGGDERFVRETGPCTDGKSWDVVLERRIPKGAWKRLQITHGVIVLPEKW